MRRNKPSNRHPEDHRQPKAENNESRSPGIIHHEWTRIETKRENEPQMNADIRRLEWSVVTF
jgi:hypothetical protein